MNLSDVLPAATGAFILLGAIALVLGGISLIIYERRLDKDAIARRVQAVRPTGSISVKARTESSATGQSFLRISGGALTERNRREVMRLVKSLGIPENFANAAFNGVRTLVALGLGVLALLSLPSLSIFAASRPLTFLAAVGIGIMGWLLPPIFVGMLADKHEAAVVQGLPDALELLVICVEAGLSLEDSLGRVSGEMSFSHPELAGELSLTLADLKILPSRDLAFTNLASRVAAPVIRSVVTTLSQTMRYGTPLAQALRVAATEMRNDSLIAMEGRANRLPALLTVPMMLFIMPTIFLIVGGPAALRVMDTFLK